MNGEPYVHRAINRAREALLDAAAGQDLQAAAAGQVIPEHDEVFAIVLGRYLPNVPIAAAELDGAIGWIGEQLALAVVGAPDEEAKAQAMRGLIALAFFAGAIAAKGEA